MVGERRVRALLHRVQQNLIFLENQAQGDRAALRADNVALAAVKYLFVITIGGCVDVAQHLCASEGWGPAATNADAMLVLARNGVLDEALARTLTRAVGFRNLLVHLYAEVDDDQVVDNLDRIGDLERFVAAVTDWVEAHPEKPQE